MADHNQGQSEHKDRRKAQATPQGSHKQKAPENQAHPEGQGHMQGLKSAQRKEKPEDFDRNEGEQREQKRP